MTLNHVALTVSDRERSAAFYARHFGMIERVHEDKHLLILGDGLGSLLALSEGAHNAASLPRTTHFGFQLGTAQAVLAAREEFQRAGVEEAEFQDDGIVRVQVLDPDGYRVEVFAY
jgi:catechol 2,3-dioxygenase-like lactoylglutathione lyase family enzyme